MVEEANTKLQDSIVNWGRLVIATGGASKPLKCVFQLVLFRWNPDGTWEYKQNKNQEEYKIVGPLDVESYAEIEHLILDTPTKRLGSMTASTGSNADAIKQMKEKAEGWLAQAISKKLHN